MKEIQLTKGMVALVDDDMYEYLNQWKWYAHKERYGYYAVRKSPRTDGKQSMIYMHTLLLGNYRLDKPNLLVYHLGIGELE